MMVLTVPVVDRFRECPARLFVVVIILIVASLVALGV